LHHQQIDEQTVRALVNVLLVRLKMPYGALHCGFANAGGRVH
jgi:hypothetical protein